VGAWLAENGLPRRARLAGVPAPPPPPRRPLVGFLELDLGRVAGTAKGAPSLALRAGASGRAFLAALTLEAWRSSFGADPGFATPRDDARLDVLAAGLDVGALRRSAWQDLEFQAGLGFHLLRAETTLEYWIVAGSSSRSMSMSELEPATSAFAALLWAGARAPWGGRSRFRFEARRWFGSTIELAALRRDVALAQASFSLSVGAELP
jgi:hypothetical protein